MRPTQKSNLRIFLIIFCFSFLFLQCDNSEHFTFPYVSVNLTFHIPTDFATLGFYDTKVIEGEGVGGILIFRISEYEFMAFDMACTYETSGKCAIIEYKNSQVIWECPCCGSQYTLMNDGCYVNKSPARWPLKRYTVIVEGQFLYIRN
jgi:nitrite reductase/ring-hydroxylating ferredoxin subunit